MNVSDGMNFRIHPLDFVGSFSFGKIELMAYKNVPFFGVKLLPVQESVQRFVIRKVQSVFIRSYYSLDHGRLQKGEKVKVNRSKGVLESHFFDMILSFFRRCSYHMYLLSFQNVSEDINPRCAVMVTAYEHYFCIGGGFGKLAYEMINIQNKIIIYTRY